MDLLIFIAVIVVLIVAHEFGHFIVAKLSGMRVDEFGIGYPPRALTLGKIGETDITLNWLPFGGFVRIFGENGGEGDPRAFSAKPRILQALVLVAGITMNFVVAWLILSGLYLVGAFGITHIPLFSALVRGAVLTYQLTVSTAAALLHFFASIVTFSVDLSQVAGPLGIAGALGTASSVGVSSLFFLVALISVNLALVNLIPVPALDGGRLLFVIIEGMFRRPLPARVAGAINGIGFAFLVLLMVVVTAHDIFSLVT